MEEEEQKKLNRLAAETTLQEIMNFAQGNYLLGTQKVLTNLVRREQPSGSMLAEVRVSKRRRSSSSGERRTVDRKRERKRKDKKKHKKHHKKRKHSSSSRSVESSSEEASEESGVGPQVPEDFYEKLELKEAQ